MTPLPVQVSSHGSHTFRVPEANYGKLEREKWNLVTLTTTDVITTRGSVFGANLPLGAV